MADISTETQAILNAVYGEEVRGSIVNALDKMNEQAAAAQEWATGEDDPTAEPSATNNAEYWAGQAAADASSAATAAASAASAAASGVEAMGMLGKLTQNVTYDYSGETEQLWSINPGGKWISYRTTEKVRTYVIPIPAGAAKIIFTGNGISASYYAVLKSYNPDTYVSAQTDADFSTGFTSRESVPQNGTTECVIPADGVYLWTMKTGSTGTDMQPIVRFVYADTDTTLSKAHISADAAAVGEAVATLEDEQEDIKTDVDLLFEKREYDFSGETEQPWNINGAGNYISYRSSGDVLRSYAVEIPDGAKKVTVTGNANYTGYIAFLQVFEPVNNIHADFCENYPNRITITAGQSYEYVIPDDCVYLWVQKISSTGTTTLPDVVFWYAISNLQIRNEYVTNNTNTFNSTQNNYEYSVTASPAITSEDLYYLPPTGDSTDRTTDIMTMLSTNGICRLGAGNYYVSGIDMPLGSTLMGVGAATCLILDASVTDGYAIKMWSRCSVQNMRVLGQTSTYDAMIPAAATPGTRVGILWTRKELSTPGSYDYPYMGIISNVRVENFAGSGLKCEETSKTVLYKLEVCNCYFVHCHVGVNIARISEFNQFTNCTFYSCYYGVINNGGNNSFANCNFESNAKCFVIDNSSGTMENNAHSGMVGCDFSHARKVNPDGTTESNKGIFIEVIGTVSGYEFSACQLGFGHIILTDAGGIFFNGCVWSGRAENDIYITRGGGVFFMSCLFGSQWSFTVVDNTTVHFAECWTKDGLTQVVGQNSAGS